MKLWQVGPRSDSGDLYSGLRRRGSDFHSPWPLPLLASTAHSIRQLDHTRLSLIFSTLTVTIRPSRLREEPSSALVFSPFTELAPRPPPILPFPFSHDAALLPSPLRPPRRVIRSLRSHSVSQDGESELVTASSSGNRSARHLSRSLADLELTVPASCCCRRRSCQFATVTLSCATRALETSPSSGLMIRVSSDRPRMLSSSRRGREGRRLLAVTSLSASPSGRPRGTVD